MTRRASGPSIPRRQHPAREHCEHWLNSCLGQFSATAAQTFTLWACVAFYMRIMKEFAASFYKSKAWQRCRDGYVRSVGGLCEKCLADGRITPGVIVHHKTPITPENIHDPTVTLSWSNLELLCRDHHAQEHGARVKRYKVDDFGRVLCI